MNLAMNIKHECFCAFVHSRLVGVGAEDQEGTPVLKDEKSKSLVDTIGKNIKDIVENIGSIKKVNEKIENKKGAFIISRQYHYNYCKIMKIMSKKLAVGDDIIHPLLGISMLYCYLDFKDKKINGISKNDLEIIINEFKDKSEENRGLVSKMLRIGTVMTVEYFKKK